MSKESLETKLIESAQQSWLKPALKILAIIGITLGIFVAGQLIPALIVVVVLGVMGNNTDQITDILSNNIAAQLVVTAGIALTTVSILWYALKLRGHNPKKFLLLDKLPSPGQLGEVVLTYGVYFMTLIAASIAISILVPGVDVDQTQELGVADTAGNGLIAVFIMLAVIPPIFEEILFRGFLYRYISRFGGVIAGYILTSVLFGAAHLEFGNLNWIAAIDTLVFSGFLIYISQKHKSLYSAIFMHAIKNSIAFFVLFVL